MSVEIKITMMTIKLKTDIRVGVIIKVIIDYIIHY